MDLLSEHLFLLHTFVHFVVLSKIPNLRSRQESLNSTLLNDFSLIESSNKGMETVSLSSQRFLFFKISCFRLCLLWQRYYRYTRALIYRFSKMNLSFANPSSMIGATFDCIAPGFRKNSYSKSASSNNGFSKSIRSPSAQTISIL